jgi:hypothetical protein
MRSILLLSVFATFFLMTANVRAQVPALPDGSQSHWVVDEPEEVVVYLVFDPGTVKDRIPSFLRFITIEELATGNVQWAMEHLKEYPKHPNWGISFIEIVRMKKFDIDGRAPQWPDNGAAALWFARVAPSNPANDLGPGKPFLVLDFWIPDSAYVSYMHSKGHYASFGDVRLRLNSEGTWLGSIEANGLKAHCSCRANGIVEGFGSRGMQVYFPPVQSGLKSIVRVAFAGHHECSCSEDSFWQFNGVHPLANGMTLGPSSFQFGYDLIGGAYHP